jgi:hypothetical protein
MNLCRIVAAKPFGKLQLETARKRWENNFNIDLRERGCEHKLDGTTLEKCPVMGVVISVSGM